VEVLREDESNSAEGEGLVLDGEAVVAEEVLVLDGVERVGEEREGGRRVLVSVAMQEVLEVELSLVLASRPRVFLLLHDLNEALEAFCEDDLSHLRNALLVRVLGGQN
jgi:hypothetical protein